MKVGTSKLGDKMRKIRALMITKRKLTSGLSDKLIAKEFGVSPDTINRAIRYALKENLVQDLEDQLLADLAPLAIKNLTASLKRTEDPTTAAVALKIFEGLGVLKKPRVDKASASEGGAGDELEYFRVKRGPAGPASPDGGLPPDGAPPLPSVHAVEPQPAPSGAAQGPPALLPSDGLDRVSPTPAAPHQPPMDHLEGELLADEGGAVDSPSGDAQ